MDYKKYKDLCIGEFNNFEKYTDEVNAEAYKLARKKFEDMFDKLVKVFEDESLDDFDEFVGKINKDKDIPEPLSEIISSIGIIKVINNGGFSSSKLAALKLMVEMLESWKG